MITTITGKNQVTVPAAIANQANIRPGMRLDWEISDEDEAKLIVRVLPDPATVASQLRGSGRRYRTSNKRSAVENLVRERSREDDAKG